MGRYRINNISIKELTIDYFIRISFVNYLSRMKDYQKLKSVSHRGLNKLMYQYVKIQLSYKIGNVRDILKLGDYLKI